MSMQMCVKGRSAGSALPAARHGPAPPPGVAQTRGHLAADSHPHAPREGGFLLPHQPPSLSRIPFPASVCGAPHSFHHRGLAVSSAMAARALTYTILSSASYRQRSKPPEASFHVKCLVDYTGLLPRMKAGLSRQSQADVGFFQLDRDPNNKRSRPFKGLACKSQPLTRAGGCVRLCSHAQCCFKTRL